MRALLGEEGGATAERGDGAAAWALTVAAQAAAEAGGALPAGDVSAMLRWRLVRQCGLCGFAAVSTSGLTAHAAAAHRGRTGCALCGRGLSDTSGLTRHVAAVHKPEQ